jgi:uncharacterized membrane protein
VVGDNLDKLQVTAKFGKSYAEIWHGDVFAESPLTTCTNQNYKKQKAKGKKQKAKSKKQKAKSKQFVFWLWFGCVLVVCWLCVGCVLVVLLSCVCLVFVLFLSCFCLVFSLFVY